MSVLDSSELDFGLGDTLTEVRWQVRRFAREQIAPLAERSTAATSFHASSGRSSAALGLLGHDRAGTLGRRQSGLSGTHRGHGGDLARQRLGRSLVRRAFEPVRQSARLARHRRAARPLSAAAGFRRTRGCVGDVGARSGLGRHLHGAAGAARRRSFHGSPAARCGSPMVRMPTCCRLREDRPRGA